MPDTPDEERSILNRVASTFSEANWLLILSASAYLFAYYFDKAYLAYFAVDSVFVEVSTQKVLLSATGFISIFLLVWQVAGALPAVLAGRVLAALIAMRVCIVLGVLAILAFLWSGFSWVFLVLALLSAFGLVCHVFSFLSVVKSGGGFGDFVQKEISEERRFDEKTISGKVLNAFGDKGLVLVMLVFFAFAVGGLTGNRFASTKSSFQVFTVESKTYILVGTNGGNFIAAGVKERETLKEKFQLTGETRVVPSSALEGLDLKMEKARAELPPSNLRPHRRSFWEFYQDNFGPEPPDRP